MRVNGPFRVGPPKEITFASELLLSRTTRELWPVIHKGNGNNWVSAICWVDYEQNATWVAEALNMLRAIEDAAVLQKSDIPEEV